METTWLDRISIPLVMIIDFSSGKVWQLTALVRKENSSSLLVSSFRKSCQLLGSFVEAATFRRIPLDFPCFTLVSVFSRVYLYAFLSATSTGSGRWDAKTYLAPKWVSHWRFSSFSLGNEGGVRFREFIVDFLWSFRKFSKSFQIFFDSKKTLFSFLFFFFPAVFIFLIHFSFFTFYFSLFIFCMFSFIFHFSFFNFYIHYFLLFFFSSMYHAFGQRPQRGRSQGDFRSSIYLAVRLFVRLPPQALSGLKSALSGLKSTLSGLKSALSSLESALSDLKSALRPAICPHRP